MSSQKGRGFNKQEARKYIFSTVDILDYLILNMVILENRRMRFIKTVLEMYMVKGDKGLMYFDEMEVRKSHRVYETRQSLEIRIIGSGSQKPMSGYFTSANKVIEELQEKTW